MNVIKEKEQLVGEILKPENCLEKELLQNNDFLKGLVWGKPRYGHPEGMVVLHIREVLNNIDRLDICEGIRGKLRLIALTHDTFKYKEDKKRSPRDWSKHHGKLAQDFMASFIDDEDILQILLLHDEAYYCWRLAHIYRDPAAGKLRLSKLLNQLGENLQLYYLFFKCDTKTGDKNQAPLFWFEKNIPGISIAKFY